MTNLTKEVLKVGNFHTIDLHHGLIFDESKGMYPSQLFGYTGPNELKVGSEVSTVFGYVSSGEINITCNNKTWESIESGYYFSYVGEGTISGNGQAVLFQRFGVRGTLTIGGPIESRGRVAYIDGCSDSLLVFPQRLGDPCLNLLVFPKNVRQTMHIHPSVRLAMVIKGTGRCITPEGELPLKAGYVFRLEEMGQHCFYTDDDSMSIVAFHPDSDWGPTDDNHPMKNRTLIQNIQ